jgi:alkanesulfonate monooxygenase SsuD/methylene tetrahydromethanopterin reductase-like flavin-dependent oxidoreductase (luciferase family)
MRFGSSEGVARIKARMAGYSNDDLLNNGMAIGGNADSVCRQVERWAATGVDQLILMFQIGRTTHDQIMRSIEIVGEKVIPKFAK